MSKQAEDMLVQGHVLKSWGEDMMGVEEGSLPRFCHVALAWPCFGHVTGMTSAELAHQCPCDLHTQLSVKKGMTFAVDICWTPGLFACMHMQIGLQPEATSLTCLCCTTNTAWTQTTHK